MTHPLQTRAERAHLHVAMLAALPTEAESFAEAIAWADADGIADLGTLFNLSDAIDFSVCQAVHNSDRQFADVDADALRAEHGAPTVNLALKLAGFHPCQRGRKMIWTDALNGEPTIAVTLTDDLLERWNFE